MGLKAKLGGILGKEIVDFINGDAGEEVDYYISKTHIQSSRKPKAKLKPESIHKDAEVNWNDAPKKQQSNRITKEDYYLNIAKAVSLRSTCLRRKYGAVIVKDDSIVSTGYNGAPRGTDNCCDTGECLRQKLNIPSGERYELCRSVHAEQNAVIAAGRKDTLGSTLYLAGVDGASGELISAPDCCMMCKRVIINSGIEKVIFLNGDGTHREENTATWINNQRENSL